MYDDNVCFKTEYGKMETVGPVDVPGTEVRWVVGSGTDAYNEAGEYLGVGNPGTREYIEVQPLNVQWEEY